MSEDHLYEPTMECHYCGKEEPQSSGRLIETDVEVGHSSSSGSYHFNKDQGFTGVSVNPGRTYYKREKVFVCSQCVHEMKTANSGISGAALLAVYMVLCLGVGGINWFFNLPFGDYVLNNESLVATVFFIIPAILYSVGSFFHIRKKNKFVDKSAANLWFGAIAFVLFFFGLSKVGEFKEWLYPSPPKPVAEVKAQHVQPVQTKKIEDETPLEPKTQEYWENKYKKMKEQQTTTESVVQQDQKE